MSRLQKELKQNKPFPSKATEAALALIRTADLIRRNMAALFLEYDITGQQFNVLRILRGAGERGLPTLEIAERMVEQTPGITRLIDRLESKQLVIRERCLTDRRQVFCRITPDGLALLAELDAPVRASEEKALSFLAPRDLTTLISLLDQARAGLEPPSITTSPFMVEKHHAEKNQKENS
ncbi:MAG TPA: MarR family transcriptional regulator [Thermoanaerobaculia bacterium]|jgi:DNA-binding MarR family transcriptional regulator